MKHDVEAAFAASELASILDEKQKTVFKIFKRTGKWNVTASASPDRDWPFSDGMISASNGKGLDVQVALEYKRPNEGAHGLLTALGQAFAYISKGYQGTIIVIPESYNGCSDPGDKIVKFINAANKDAPIGVYTYKSSLIMSGSFSFKGNLVEKRPLKFLSGKIKPISKAKANSTIWVHFREGSSEYDDVYRYCYEGKHLDESKAEKCSLYKIPTKLEKAVNRISTKKPYLFLSSSTNSDSSKNMIWRAYWFKYMAHSEMLIPFVKDGSKYRVNIVDTNIRVSGGSAKRQFFRTVKKKIVDQLNKGIITEDQAWEIFAENVNKRAHSYRIDLEAFCHGIGFVNADFKLTELGFRYVNSCSGGNPFSEIPQKIYAGACLNNGNINVFLQFFYNVSEELLKSNALSWAIEKKNSAGNVIGYKFDAATYREDIEKEFKKLHIIKKVSTRSGTKRPALKAEICLLTMLGLSDGKYRVGVGLPIDWVKVQAINDYYVNNKLDELEACNY